MGDDEVRVGERTFVFKLELNSQKSPSILLTAEVLEYVRVGCLKAISAKEGSEFKRNAKLEVKGIRQIKHRKLVTGRAYSVETSKTEQVSLKPITWSEPHISNAATELKARIDAGDQTLFKAKFAADDDSSSIPEEEEHGSHEWG